MPLHPTTGTRGLPPIRGALDKALRTGQTFHDFRKELTPIPQAKGWWGRQVHVDKAGNAESVQLGSPRRLYTIFHTNLQSAYMAERYQAMQDSVDTHPYWRYVAILDRRTRPAHKALNGRVFRHDDPIWATCYPPNGFNCRCRVQPMTERAIERQKVDVSSSAGRLRTVQVESVSRTTGEVFRSQRTGIGVVGEDGKKLFFAPDMGFNSTPAAWHKPFTPPPQDTLPRTLLPGQMLPPLPPPAKVAALPLLPKGTRPAAQIKGFLRAFGATSTKPAVFKDATGEALVIGADLFAGKALGDRGRALPLLAAAIQAPDEIWLQWQDGPGGTLLRRRYLKRIAGSSRAAAVIFDLTSEGWTAETLFDPTDAAVDVYRGGFLQFRGAQ